MWQELDDKKRNNIKEFRIYHKHPQKKIRHMNTVVLDLYQYFIVSFVGCHLISHRATIQNKL